jgi:hypothetical protein
MLHKVKDAVEHALASEFVVGNKIAEFIYVTKGSLVYKLFIKDLYEKPMIIEFNIVNMRIGMKYVLFEETQDHLMKKRDITTSDVQLWSDMC